MSDQIDTEILIETNLANTHIILMIPKAEFQSMQTMLHIGYRKLVENNCNSPRHNRVFSSLSNYKLRPTHIFKGDNNG